MNTPTDDDDYVETPGDEKGLPLWWRAKAFSHMTGLSVEMIENAAARGELPVRVQRFGAKRVAFVSKADPLAYLAAVRGPKVPA